MKGHFSISDAFRPVSMCDALSKLPTSAQTVSWAESHPSLRVLRAFSVALVWVRSLPPGPPAQHLCMVLARLKRRGQFGFVQGNTYSSSFEIDIQGRLSSRQWQPSSPSLLPDKLRHFPVSGDCFEQYKQQSLQNLLAFPFLQLLFFARTVLLSQTKLPCLSLHEATSDRVLSLGQHDSCFSPRNILL